MLRILVNVALLFSVLFFPWWLSALLGAAAIFYFRRFFEAVGWAFVFDLLYGTRVAAFYDFQFFATLGAVILLAISEWAKGYLRI